MIFKIIDGITKLLYDVVKWLLVLLGMYSVIEIVFNLDIPIGFSLLIILFAFAIGYFASQEDDKIDSIPIMIVRDGKPIDAKEVINNGLG